MSWPDDGEPRFKVDIVRGFRINQQSGITSPSNTRKPKPVASVQDRAYCHREVKRFDHHRRTAWPDGVVAAAHAYAAELNERDRAET